MQWDLGPIFWPFGMDQYGDLHFEQTSGFSFLLLQVCPHLRQEKRRISDEGRHPHPAALIKRRAGYTLKSGGLTPCWYRNCSLFTLSKAPSVRGDFRAAMLYKLGV